MKILFVFSSKNTFYLLPESFYENSGAGQGGNQYLQQVAASPHIQICIGSCWGKNRKENAAQNKAE
jgi:hypothetical protein